MITPLRVASRITLKCLSLRRIGFVSKSIVKCLAARPYSNTHVDYYFESKYRPVDDYQADEWSNIDSRDIRLINYDIPQRVRQKIISAEDAVALVRDGDTVCVSGFVTQG